MTYNEAYNKIIDAYFKDEINAVDSKFCFCGTLCDNNRGWFGYPRRYHYDLAGYTGGDFVRMETALLDALDNDCGASNKEDPNYEDALFKGMCAALEVLKQIHIERNEDVEEKTFTKRLKTAI